MKTDTFSVAELAAAKKTLDDLPRPDDYLIEWNGEMLVYRAVPQVLKLDGSWFPKMSVLVSPSLRSRLARNEEIKAVVGSPAVFGSSIFATIDQEREAAILKLAPFLALRRPLTEGSCPAR